MNVIVHPGVPRGSVAVPPSKSAAHRALICAALSKEVCAISGVDYSEDILATLDCLEALGAKIRREGSTVFLHGCDPRLAGPSVLQCRESGSTLRFMLPLCLLSGRPMRLEGSPTLLSRPLSVYETLCRERGLRLERRDGSLWAAGILPPGEYAVPGNISSQFVTGLLFALPLLSGDSVLRLIPPLESRSYLDLTLAALRRAGIRVDTPDDCTFLIPGGGEYRAASASIEGDWSNAAFFLAMNALGGSIALSGLQPDSLQGDRVCREYLAELAAGTPTLDISDCPDLAPALFAAAALLNGAVFTGTRRLRFKESDRGAVMAEEMAKFGLSVQLEENRAVVSAGNPRRPSVPLSSHNDHRIAMALSLLCLRTGGEILDAGAVRKSFPDYWARLRSLGIRVESDSLPGN